MMIRQHFETIYHKKKIGNHLDTGIVPNVLVVNFSDDNIFSISHNVAVFQHVLSVCFPVGRFIEVGFSERRFGRRALYCNIFAEGSVYFILKVMEDDAQK